MRARRLIAAQALLIFAGCRAKLSVGELPEPSASTTASRPTSVGGSSSSPSETSSIVPRGGASIRFTVTSIASTETGGSATGGSATGGSATGGSATPTCRDPSGLLANPGFEEGRDASVPAWIDLDSRARVDRTVANALRGNAALVLQHDLDESQGPVFRQTLNLEPYTPYLLRGWMRATQGVDTASSRGFAELCAEPYFLACIGPKTFASIAEAWQPFELDFETGYDGRVALTGRVIGKGQVYFDDLSIACNPVVERFESEHFILDMRPAQLNAVERSAIGGVVNRTERVIQALADLTGQPPLLDGHRQAAFAPPWFEALGWRADEPGGAGYPFLWRATPAMLQVGWGRSDYVPESFLRAIAQNFNSSAFDFELPGNVEAHDTTGLLVYYLYEQLGLSSIEPTLLIGTANRERYAEAYDTYWIRRHCARSDALAYRDILIAARVGWQPIRAAYRALSAAPNGTSPWQRVERFHRVIADDSGRALVGTSEEVTQDKALFSSGEWEDVRGYYSRSLEVEYPAPSYVDSSMTELALARAQWDTASTDWAIPMRQSLADGCPLRTETRAYETGLWAHASSRYVFELGGKWQRLETDYGLPLGVSGGSVFFEVRGDGKVLYSSARIADSVSRRLSVEIANVQQLELVTESKVGADGQIDETSAWGMWLEPTLFR